MIKRTTPRANQTIRPASGSPTDYPNTRYRLLVMYYLNFIGKFINLYAKWTDDNTCLSVANMSILINIIIKIEARVISHLNALQPNEIRWFKIFYDKRKCCYNMQDFLGIILYRFVTFNCCNSIKTLGSRFDCDFLPIQ